MTRAADPPAMRNSLLLLVAAAACSSCASTQPAEAPAPAASEEAAAVIQVHYVRDLATTLADVAALADEIRTSLVRGSTDGEQRIRVGAHESGIVVVADRASQAAVAERLTRLRGAKAP